MHCARTISGKSKTPTLLTELSWLCCTGTLNGRRSCWGCSAFGGCGAVGRDAGLGGCGAFGPGAGEGFGGCGAFGPGAGAGFGGCGARDCMVAESSVSSVPAGSPERARICSTMLLPSSAKARCATVSPTDRAVTAVTADCVLGSLLETALEFCRRFVSNSRSCGLRMRSSRINVSEKESRICFAVIRHTPPNICLNVLVPVGRNGEAAFAETVPPRQAIIKQKNYRLAMAPIIEWKIFIPSVQPSSGSAERSG